jgi:hypothetical protein
MAGVTAAISGTHFYQNDDQVKRPKLFDHHHFPELAQLTKRSECLSFDSEGCSDWSNFFSSWRSAATWSVKQSNLFINPCENT